MTPRVERLRRESLNARPSLSAERAMLVTEAMQTAGALAPPLQRAAIFAHVMERKALYIGADELIVGERGPAPKATPTFPELCCHSLQDLDILHTRERISFCVSPEAQRAYAERIIPFWTGRSMREAIFRECPGRLARRVRGWSFHGVHGAAGAGPHRPGRRDLSPRVPRARGRRRPRAVVARRRRAIRSRTTSPLELRAMRHRRRPSCGSRARHAAYARELAAREADPVRRGELRQIAANCDRVPAHAPQTFFEALQAYWFVHLGVVTELNTWDSFSPGRLDQHLEPFYQRDLAKAGSRASRRKSSSSASG